MTQKTVKRKHENNISIEDIYRNKNFVRPKEKTFETIFEEPRVAKDGAQQLTSVKKYKRFLDFDRTEGKTQKRRNKVKRCIKRTKPPGRKTRSATKTSPNVDISFYIPEGIDDSSQDDPIKSKPSSESVTDSVSYLTSQTFITDQEHMKTSYKHFDNETNSKNSPPSTLFITYSDSSSKKLTPDITQTKKLRSSLQERSNDGHGVQEPVSVSEAENWKAATVESDNDEISPQNNYCTVT